MQKKANALKAQTELYKGEIQQSLKTGPARHYMCIMRTTREILLKNGQALPLWIHGEKSHSYRKRRQL